MPGALSGVRVIDFGQYIAGPMTAMLLGDQGADVIRVDPPGGTRWNSPANATYNRNKRSIVLDLKWPQGRETAERLIQGADVVVENFRPGVMDRLGLGAAVAAASNPGLIYCSLPGFASDDPRRDVRAWEGVVAAATATYRFRPGTSRPVYTAVPLSSTYAAFQASVSIAMALNAREISRVGQVIEVPLYDATFGASGGGGAIDRRAAQDPLMAANAGVSGQFQCQDGRWVMYMGGNLNARDFLEATGAAEWVDAARGGKLSAEEMRARVEAMFRTKTAAEWEDFCEKVGTECAVCRPSAEWLRNPGALGSEIIVDIADPELGTVRGPGINVRMSKTPGTIVSPRPLLDANRAEIMAEVKAAPAATARPATETALRSALEGVRVIDLCIVLAGPTCGRTLAEFGADVIKIDSPSRPAVAFHNEINRGKRSIVLDLKSKEGMEVFWKLVDSADVVVQNFRKGVADRLGFGYEAVKARKPDIVYASLNTYGQTGPFAGRPGHEQIGQAATGMQERYGGDGRPTLSPFAPNDYGTGYMGAYGVALALLHRRKTGEGQHVSSALAFTGTMLQSSLIQDYEGKKWDEPRGQEALGSGPLHRAYEAADGWVFVAARESDVAACPELSDLAGRHASDLEAALEARLRDRRVDDWVGALTASGIGAHRVVPSSAELHDDPWLLEHGIFVTRDHDDIGPLRTTGPSPRLSRTPPIVGRPAPRPGSDARSILDDVGMASDHERLVQAGVVVMEGITAR